MRRIFIGLLIKILFVSFASAKTGDVIQRHIIPNYTALYSASSSFYEMSLASCDFDELRIYYNQLFDTWMAVSHISFGPIEKDGAYQSIVFWPDKKGFTRKSLKKLIKGKDPIIYNPVEFRKVSIASKGIFALEMLLYDDEFKGLSSSYSCDLIKAISLEIRNISDNVLREWIETYQYRLLSPSPDSKSFHSSKEVDQIFYTTLISSLQFTLDQRVYRPLGTKSRSKPRRSEAYRSSRSFKNILLQLKALKKFSNHFVDVQIPKTDRTFDRAISYLTSFETSLLKILEDEGKIRSVEILAWRLEDLIEAIKNEIGPILGVGVGFNAMDGD